MFVSEDAMNRLAEVLRSDRLSHADLPDEGSVLLDLEEQQVLSLNEVGMFLVHQIRREGRATERVWWSGW